MSHLLRTHQGACKNIHGHSYRLFVTLLGTPNTEENSPELGMVMDFGNLKRLIHKSIIEVYDHALVVSEKAYHDSFLENYNGKIIIKNFEPTCENLIIDFALTLKNQLPTNVKLHSLKLHETFTSFCEWHSDDNE